jgi:hypothetical protein
MAANQSSIPSPISLMLTQVQRLRLEAAARCTGVHSETFITNTLMGAVRTIEASEAMERRLLILLLTGATWESISKALDIPVPNLKQAATAIAAQMFRGHRHAFRRNLSPQGDHAASGHGDDWKLHRDRKCAHYRSPSISTRP